MAPIGPFRATKGGRAEVIFVEDVPVVTVYSCNELKQKELCQPVGELCSNAGTMWPDDVGMREDVKPVCREKA